MSIEITGLTKNNFQDVVTLAHQTLSGAHDGDFKRAAAQQFIIGNQDGTNVLVVDGIVAGAYAFRELPNVYSLSFFALREDFRKTKAGYKLYLHMKNRLRGRPVNVVIYDDNDPMINVVKSRGVFVGRTPSVNDKTLSFYSILFDDFDKKGKR